MKRLGVFLLLVGVTCTQAEYRWDFEGLSNGTLPESWIIESTGKDVPLGGWISEEDASAPSGPGVLRLIDTHHNINHGFNLCWTDAVLFHEGEISVWLKEDSGKRDRGGGPIWRVQDCNNYYIARYNPLEKNVSIYYTKDGQRIILGYSGTLPAKYEWNHLKIIHTGGVIRAYLNDQMVLMVNDGGHIPIYGGVGLWTKADAATSFDGFAVMPR